MSYEDKIKETQQTAFAELYDITIGDRAYYYTSYREDIAYGENLYVARPIKRESFRHSSKDFGMSVRVTIPYSSALSDVVSVSPILPVTVRITRVFLDTYDAYSLFYGEIIDYTISKHAISVTIASDHELRRRIPRFVYQSYCNNELFDSVCGLNEETYKTSAIVTVANNTLVSSTFATFSDGYFRGGHVKLLSGYDFRLITEHIGDTITLQVAFPASSLSSGDTILAYPGCDKAPATCRDKFSNLMNFVGFPYIPSSNPTIYGIR